MVAVATCAVMALAGMLWWFSLKQSLPPGSHYVPAQLEGGRVIPGHGAP